MIDLHQLIEAIERVIASHNLGKPGVYRRWNISTNYPQRDSGLNPYGCADAANILYTIQRFPRQPEERQGWVETLQNLQDRQDGLFHEATHHPIHTTAHCIAALELFDAVPRLPLTGLETLCNPEEMAAFLDNLDWRAGPGNASHQGAGIYAALVLTGRVTLAWQECYFAWLWQEADAASGFWRKDCIRPETGSSSAPIFHHLAGSFHYLFNHEYARQPLHYPQKMVDSCLDIYQNHVFPLGTTIGFAEIDWVYCLNRSLRMSHHRAGECRAALEDFAQKYCSFLCSIDAQKDDAFNDLHALFGALCALAELQSALPGMIRTPRPLRLVLDRRPFI